jgi:hypothetical protein
MNEIDKLFGKVTKIIGKNTTWLPKPAYDFVRRYEALFCVDAVLVPVGKKPSVLLLKRQMGGTSGGEHYTVGGRLGKKRDVMGAMREKIRAETGLAVSVNEKNIIGFGTVWYAANRKEGHPDFSVFTPCLSFAVRVPNATKLTKKISVADGNVGWEVFDRIQPEWDGYVTEAVAAAWDHFYGKGWRTKHGKMKAGNKRKCSFVGLTARR